MSIKIEASDPKGAKGRRTSPPGIMPSRPAKELPDGQSLTIHIYKIGIHPVALPPHPCLPQGGEGLWYTGSLRKTLSASTHFHFSYV